MRFVNKTKMAVLAATAITGLTLTGCIEDGNDSQRVESQAQQDSYDALVKNQPAIPMSYSPTRETVNEWSKTWSEPGKLSYIYFLNTEGEAWGYYVLQGLPVSYCAMLTPTYEEYEDREGYNHIVDAPGIDAAYYSGGQCNTYYGLDATTGTMVEWTAGLGTSTVTYEEPMSFPGARALGPTEVEDVQK